jgi:hypothetical protein
MVSALARHPRFPGAFVSSDHPRLFTNQAGKQFRTIGFGTQGKHSATYDTAVRVLHDDLDGAFCVRLAVMPENDGERECMVLLREPKLKSLTSAAEHMHSYMAAERKPEREIEQGGKRWLYLDTLQADDVLWLPTLHASLTCDYEDLMHKPYLRMPGPGPLDTTWWEIGEATQVLSFRLTPKGALVEATFKIVADVLAMSDPGGPPAAVPPPKPLIYPKQLIFDKSFVFSLWKEGADWPYLMAWVDGPEMLDVMR